MRLGCCSSVDQAAVLKDAGFDYIEVPVQSTLCGEMDDATWRAQAVDPAKMALPMEVAYMLVPAILPVVGPTRDLHALNKYMQRVARRANVLGIKRLVFGSGGARRCPDGFDEAVAAQQIVEFCRLAGDVCGGEDVLLVVEHLHKAETNMITTLVEEKALLEEVDHPCVAGLVDNYHYGLEGEGDQPLLDLGSSIRHVHVAEVAGRCQPGAHEDGAAGEAGEAGEGGGAYDFEHFFTLLRKVGYDERVSIEANWIGDMQTVGAKCANYLRQAWAKAVAVS